MYGNVHTFLNTYTWKATDGENGLGGATWIELFTLLGRSGYGNMDALRKTAKAKGKDAKLKNMGRSQHKFAKDVAQVATPLHHELVNFRKIVRYRTNHDFTAQQTELFKADKRPHKRDT